MARHSERIETAVFTTAVVLLLAAMLWRYAERRPPYFAAPATVVDHVERFEHETHDVLLLIPKIAPLLPRGAEVTCFRPKDGQQHPDSPNYLTAVGLLPQQSVFPPFTAANELPREQLIEWVIAVREPFQHPAYRLVASFPEGALYRVQR
jgi:hypothetical protein